MRWGDIDSYRHVNNVRYLDYAAEGRDRLVREGILAPDHRVSGVSVDYLAPLHLTRRPVVVTHELEGDQLVQQICIDRPEGRTVHCRLTTQLAAVDAPRPVPDRDGVWLHDVPVRLDDLGPDGLVSVSRAADIVQEMRIAHRGHLDSGVSFGESVVAAVRLDLHGPLRRGDADQVARSWTSRVGTSSYVLELEIRSGEHVLLRARSVMVTIDSSTQRARPLTDEERSIFVVTPDA